jgi:hypothetical protein
MSRVLTDFNVPLTEGDSAARSARRGSSTSHVEAGLGTQRNISAGLTPRLALRAQAVPLREGDNKTETAFPKSQT